MGRITRYPGMVVCYLLRGGKMKRTVVINLFAGSGAGKSTTAAALYAKMKQQGKNVELVREYIKDWAWTGRKPDSYDQIYIMGKQINAESHLYHKVDYIVTDSPFLLSPFYERHHQKTEITLPSCFEFKKWAEQNDIVFLNYFLVRHKKFDPRGRYETEEQAKAIDMELQIWLYRNNVTFSMIDVPDAKRVDAILKHSSKLPKQGRYGKRKK